MGDAGGGIETALGILARGVAIRAFPGLDDIDGYRPFKPGFEVAKGEPGISWGGENEDDIKSGDDGARLE